uniref:Uncharacterized protein n=1 Tax=Rousettus aegyptiacus TaxID=9407 RepID=A0A7J8HS43_ROUAE|nr:hypothetical protein HJG63_010879 [Rousettus aegyptiacus]
MHSCCSHGTQSQRSVPAAQTDRNGTLASHCLPPQTHLLLTVRSPCTVSSSPGSVWSSLLSSCMSSVVRNPTPTGAVVVTRYLSAPEPHCPVQSPSFSAASPPDEVTQTLASEESESLETQCPLPALAVILLHLSP